MNILEMIELLMQGHLKCKDALINNEISILEIDEYNIQISRL